MAAGEIARELGMICSFMPKPSSKRTGSGMHMHMSLADEKQPNLFSDKSDSRKLGLSTLAYHFLGGLLEHAPALTALVAPTVNSYKRLVVGESFSGATWAPAFSSYGDNNRSCMVRVPYGRLEMRLIDSSANPYLVSAAVIAAGLDGVDRQLESGEPQNFNHYLLDEAQLANRGIKTLPQSLDRALDSLVADKLFEDSLGKQFIEEFVRLKRMEWVEYHRHVSDWELKRYLEFYQSTEVVFVCGIIGLLAKTKELRNSLGALIVPMFNCMADRGPDSAGLAVFSAPVDAATRRVSLSCTTASFDWGSLLGPLKSDFGAEAGLNVCDNQAELMMTGDVERLRRWLKLRDYPVRILAVGRSIELLKDVGRADEVAIRYEFSTLSGTHCVGHTRMLECAPV